MLGNYNVGDHVLLMYSMPESPLSGLNFDKSSLPFRIFLNEKLDNLAEKPVSKKTSVVPRLKKSYVLDPARIHVSPRFPSLVVG